MKSPEKPRNTPSMWKNQRSVYGLISKVIVILFMLGLISSLFSTVTGQTEENLPPVANVYLDPTRHPVVNSVKVLEQVYFIGEDSYDPNPEDNLTYHWEFGDGGTSSQVSPTHIYKQIGEYLVQLTVNDTKTSTVKSVIVAVYTEGGNEPVANIWLDANRDEKGNNHANVSETVSFDAIHSYDPDGSLLSYKWDFGDGVKSMKRDPSHQYKEEGVFTVVLTIEDEEQLVTLDSISIVIGSGKSSGGGGGSGDEGDAFNLGYLFLGIVVIVIILLVVFWMYLGRARRRTLARTGGLSIQDEPPILVPDKTVIKTPAPQPEFVKKEVKSVEKKARAGRMDKLAKSEAKLKQAMLRKKLQDERKKLDDDMKKELEDLGIEL